MTRWAPKRFAGKARIPLPVPRSASDPPGLQPQVSCSKRRSDNAVVACSPVPKAVEGGITRRAALILRTGGCAVLSASDLAPRRGLRWGQRTLQRCDSLMDLTIINRFPTLIGLESLGANHSSQLRGNVSMRPPNSLSSAHEPLREWHTTLTTRRLRPGLRTITSWS